MCQSDKAEIAALAESVRREVYERLAELIPEDKARNISCDVAGLLYTKATK
jgi:hypothetical protein